jgi:hypothetical protein
LTNHEGTLLETPNDLELVGRSWRAGHLT